MNKRTRYVGLDVHKATITVSVAEVGPAEEVGTIPNDPSSVRKLVGRLGGPGVQLVAAYEAGPTGYVLHRQLTGLGVDCVVVAPSLVPSRPGDRIKTDRRDSLKLARLLRSGDLTSVWVPDEEHEALRSLVRARADAKVDQLRARHRLTKFFLRTGLRSPAGVRAWSVRWEAWLSSVRFPQANDQIVFEDYRSVVRGADQRLQRLETALREAGAASRHAPIIRALQAMRGVGHLTAISIVAESGDLRRFATARHFMSYCGLVPSEHSSGGTRHRGRITKTGNAPLRHVLGEAAHHSWRAPRVTPRLESRQRGVPPAVIALDWSAQQRLHLRYQRLAARIGRPKAITAVARELAGFVWSVGQLVPQERAAA
jgi:transposase